jgi:hypothetical protein
MNEPITLDLSVILPIIIIQGILIVVAVIDWIKNQESIRGNRWVWLAVIVFLNIVGPIVYFIFGKKR